MPFLNPQKALYKAQLQKAVLKRPVSGAVVSVEGRQTITDEKGQFSFSRLAEGKYELTVNSLGHKMYSQSVTCKWHGWRLDISLVPVSLYLQPLEVRSVRASDKAPFAKSNLSKEEIAKNNLGQDIPFLLDQTPSVVVNSDAGMAWVIPVSGSGEAMLHELM
jgi:iron complex outermembrane receptor protein